MTKAVSNNDNIIGISKENVIILSVKKKAEKVLELRVWTFIRNCSLISFNLIGFFFGANISWYKLLTPLRNLTSKWVLSLLRNNLFLINSSWPRQKIFIYHSSHSFVLNSLRPLFSMMNEFWWCWSTKLFIKTRQTLFSFSLWNYAIN